MDPDVKANASKDDGVVIVVTDAAVEKVNVTQYPVLVNVNLAMLDETAKKLAD